jgi:hypothetical protein
MSTRTGWPWHTREVCPACGRTADAHDPETGACLPSADEAGMAEAREVQGDIFTALDDWYETEGSADVSE